MAGVRISLNEVNEASTQIRALSATIYDTLTQMRNEMDSLSSTWMSEGGEQIRTRFRMFSSRFENMKEVIDSYAEYLDLAVSSYDSYESVITSNASNVQY
ncbi:MAG: pore-forming ESAT-6 family protein [Bulleidia sp.]